jgi:hypothetical protein
MKKIIEILIVLFLLTSILIAQQKDYWENAPVEGSKIYLICFTDQENGYAISANDEVFVTANGGSNWQFIKDKKVIDKSLTNDSSWSADIYCSVLQTTDGGISWRPYANEMQEHFCKVYLKDPNVDYKTASEFLAKVAKDILDNLSNNRIESIINHPKQCTEYYSNEDEGWALGWCIKEFKMSEKIED